jgi:predicted ABC-class ATPase
MIFVIGGLGSFLQKADTCLLMENYQCKNITDKVRNKLGDINEDNYPISFSAKRILSTDNFNPEYINQRLKKAIASRIKDLRNAPRQLEYGMDLINLEALPQVVEAPQILSIGYCLLAIRDNMQENPENKQSIEDWLQWLYQQLSENGLDFLQPDYLGTLSLPRKYEVAAAINRLRSLKMSP